MSVTDSVAGCARDLRSVQETTGKIEHAVCFQCQIQALHASVDRIEMFEEDRLKLYMNIY